MAPAWAAKFIGIPYAVGGRTHAGLDCYGLVWLVLTEVFGVEPPRYDASSAERFTSAIGESHWVPVTDPQPGDVVLLALAGHPAHCGVMLGPGQMLHAVEGVSTCMERTDGTRWAKRVISYYRHRDLYA